MDDIKYCEDCRFFQATADLENARCLYPRQKTAKELVSRSLKPALRFCDYERGRTVIGDSCGPEAQWFEPKSIAEAAE